MITLQFIINDLTIEELEQMTILFWENRTANPNILMAEA